MHAVQRVGQLGPSAAIRILVPSFRKEGRLITRIVSTRPRVVSRGVRAIHHVDPLMHDTTGCRADLRILQRVTRDGAAAGSNVVIKLNRAPRRIRRLVSSLHQISYRVLAVNRCLRPARGRCPMTTCVAPRRFTLCERGKLGGKFRRIRDTPLMHSSCRTRGRVRFVRGEDGVKGVWVSRLL